MPAALWTATTAKYLAAPGNDAGECSQLEQVSEQMFKQKTMVSTALEAFQRKSIISKLALKRFQQTLKILTQQVEGSEAELLPC
jgi:hypothetical protein